MQAKQKRKKGGDYERFVASRLAEVWPKARRGIGQTRAAGEVPDIQGTPLWVEAKHRRSISVHAAIAQARAAMADWIARGGDPLTYRAPALALRLDSGKRLPDGTFERREDLVVLPLEEFLRLAKLAEVALAPTPPPPSPPPDPAPEPPASPR